MSRAAEITRINHTATQVRRAAQKACASMSRSHVDNCDLYTFTDGSSIAVTGNNISTAGGRK